MWAATIVHHGMGHDLYNTALQKQVRDSLFQHPVPLFFEHPPFEALLLSPLASYSFRTAYLIWGLMNATIWLGSIFALRQYLHWPGETLGYVILWLVFAPLWVALYQGQSSAAAAGGLRSHVYLSEAREKSFGWDRAGIWTLQVSICSAIRVHLFIAEAMAIPCWIFSHRSRLGPDLDCGSRLEGCGGLWSFSFGNRK